MAATSSTSEVGSTTLSSNERLARLLIATALGALQGLFCLPVLSPFIGHQDMQVPHAFVGLLPGALLPAVLVALPPVLSVWFDRRLAGRLIARLVTTLVCFGTIGGLALYAWSTVPVDPRSLSSDDWFWLFGIIYSSSYYIFVQSLISGLSLLLPTAAAFAVGGLGGYPSRWAGRAIGAGLLAWLGFGVIFLTVSVFWDMTQINHLFVSTVILYFYSPIWLVGLLVAAVGGLVGGALRAWLGRVASTRG